jgi:hypothetical protein
MPEAQEHQRKLLGNPHRHLLFVKGTLDTILARAEDLPDQLKETLVAARDLAWQYFTGKTERNNKPTP